MKDNETLSGAKDTLGGRGGFGARAGRPLSFRAWSIFARSATSVRERSSRAILDCSARLARLVGLSDCFSIDFRIDAIGRPIFFEFEVCPAVTIYDFQNYLAGRGLTLGEALAKAMRLAFARRRALRRRDRGAAMDGFPCLASVYCGRANVGQKWTSSSAGAARATARGMAADAYHR